MRPKKMEDLTSISAREVKRAAAEERKRTARVEVKGKVIATSFLKIEGRGTFVGAKDRRKKDG